MGSIKTMPPAFRRRPLAILLATLCATPAFAADETATQAEEKSLAPVTVTATNDATVPSERTGLYTTKSSRSATGLDLSLRETPNTVSVITRSQLNDFQLNSVNDALAASSGIVVERPETDRTYFTARGFDVTNFQFDGIGVPFVYDIVNGDIDTAIYDRIEVVYGANGLMTPTGFPSATVNFIRKRPTTAFAASAGLTGGSWDRYRLDADVSGPLIESGQIRGRMVFAKENANSYLDRYEQDKTVFYGIVEADIAESTQLAIGYNQQVNKPVSPLWGALPLFNTDGSRTNYDVSTSTAANWARWESTTRSTFVELNHQFNEDWQAKAIYTNRQFTNDSTLFYAYGTPDRNTGLGLYSYPSQYDMTNKQNMFDVFATGHFSLGGRKHDLTFGANWARSSLNDESRYGQGIGTALPPLQDWRGEYPMPTFDAATDGSSFTDKRLSAYVATRLNLADPFKVILGARATKVEVTGYSYGENRYSDTDDVSPYVGAIYDLSEQVSLYGSYTNLFNPQHQLDITGTPLTPVTGNSKEVGLKSDWFGKKLNASLAYFWTEQRNLAQSAGYTANFKAYYEGVDAESDGFQIDVGGALTDNWQVNFGYTQFSLTDPQGNDVRTYTPRKLMRLSTVYRLPFLESLKVGANVSWQDGIYRNDVYDYVTGATTEVRQSAYTLLNLMARYDIDKNLSVNANFNNVTDEKYITSLMWSQGYYGAPRNFSVSLNWKY
ncbi:MAG: TonB-dependent siderophore receptor [Azonexus sp.]|nr:TonB-dependent siderophore receptor [Azonexus sp.]